MNKTKPVLGQDILVLGLIVGLVGLGVAHFLNLGLTVQPIEWVVMYVLVGFIGGLLFYLIDPLATQEFKWKGVATLGGGAATGATFMLLAKVLTPETATLVTNRYHPAVLPVFQTMTLGNGASFKVLEVKSLTDDKLSNLFQQIVGAMRSELGSDPSDDAKRQLMTSFLTEVELRIGLGAFADRLKPLADTYLKGDRKAVDQQWEDIIDEHLDTRCSRTQSECRLTFNRLAFAVYRVGDPSSPRFGVALPGTAIKVDNEDYEVITFANPRQSFSEEIGLTAKLFEGVVLMQK
jgi:hypothetical protein